MRFSDHLNSPMLTTDEWLAKHDACLQPGETFDVPVVYSADIFMLVCGCGRKHLCWETERAALATHPRMPPGVAGPRVS